MKIAILALVVASGMSWVAASQVSAAPADGAAMARVAQTVDPAITVATKKKAAAKPACAVDQTRSNRTGNCRPLTSEEK